MAVIIHLNDEFYAQCQCGSQSFSLLVNGPGDAWDRVLGTECTGCGYVIKWTVVKDKKRRVDEGNTTGRAKELPEEE